MTNYKVVFVGSSKSGKSSFINYVKTGIYDKKYRRTFGTELQVIDNISVGNSLCCWDIGGKKKFCGMEHLRSGYYFGADLCVVFIPCDKQNGLATAIKLAQEFKQVCPDKPIISVYSKADLGGNNNNVLSLDNHNSVERLLKKMCEALAIKYDA